MSTRTERVDTPDGAAAAWTLTTDFLARTLPVR